MSEAEFVIHAGDEIEEAITEHWGPRCPDFSEHCSCCKAWAKYDMLHIAYLVHISEIEEKKG